MAERRSWPIVVAPLLVWLLTSWPSAAAQSLESRMLAAEDGRAATASELKPILDGLRQRDPALVAQAVRALGRFERPALVPTILPILSNGRAQVRAEAVNALGQALAALPRETGDPTPLPPEAATVADSVATRMRIDLHPYVVGVAAETLGRLPYRDAGAVRKAEQAIAALLTRRGNPAAQIGAVKGLEALLRVHGRQHPPLAATVQRLREAATWPADPSDGDFAFIRRVAWMGLIAARAAAADFIERGLQDSDAQVRRLAVAALANLDDEAGRVALLQRAYDDSSFHVRYEAVRVANRTAQSASCGLLLKAADDPDRHVSLAALDALGDGCPAGPSPVARLLASVNALPEDDAAADWHAPAHAFVSLARVSREEATPRLERFGEHPVWQVRMYAARAATVLLAAARLERLAADEHDNVREAALAGLLKVRGHQADRFFIDALARPDYQLVLTAARALEGSPNGEQALPALLAALARISAEGRDTSRDPRMAILARVREFGSGGRVQSLQPCLADVDPVVAAECGAILQAWTGKPHPARPAARQRRSAMTRPSASRARVTMARGGAFELRLLPDEAPATVERFVQLARKSYYNGLTFHRVAPNFVIQGGSPGANEYMGDGPYMRDELGLRSHRRGTVGISTRGRDTGDAQIFVNLLDNPRLDHNFTVFAEVTAGLHVVDGILEGDVIARIEVLDAPTN